MRKLEILTIFLIAIQTTVCTLYKRDYENRLYYTVRTSNEESVQKICQHLEARCEGRVGELPNHYWISIPKNHPDLVERFHKAKSLYKRDFDPLDQLEPQLPTKRLYKRAPPIFDPVVENKEEEYRINNELPSLDEEGGYDIIRKALGIHDPGFERQWHLINKEERGHDLNITGVWHQNITGKGVVVAILDDGIELDHEDLKNNYFAEGSYDFNDHVKDPKPRLFDDTHGTRCAGEIAAVRNGVCGVGVAYDAKVAGIRILSGSISEADEATALNYEYQKNHIYSCSWGPSDMGQVAEAPKGVVLEAIKNGIKNGRNGTGSIFVFASGNGGSHDDNCNFDGYTNSIYTITVGAIDKLGNYPYYAEKCAAQLLVTYSSGNGEYIYTTDIGDNKCSDHHGGTSAAAPLAAGVFALVLSIRPDLTWRDLQHLCVQSAIPFSLDDEDWAKLPSGRLFSHKYGYGVLDAYRIVELAKDYKLVGEQTAVKVLSETPQDIESLPIPDITPESGKKLNKTDGFRTTLSITKDMIESANLKRLEHVTAKVNIKHQRRGDMEILLESPNKVISQLATPRQYDTSTEGLMDWTFMTVKHWEEEPVGNWTLHIIDGKNPEYKGQFINWELTLWGESTKEATIKEDNIDDFERSKGGQSFIDNGEKMTDKKSSSYLIYALASMFMVFTIISTGFIVKKYFYKSIKKEDTYEFDNLLSRSNEFELSDEEEENRR